MAISKKLTYQEALNEMEAILEKMENNEFDIDELSEKVNRISFLLKFCRDKLLKTKDEVEGILNELEKD